VFGFAPPTSVSEIMKLWDAENDKDTQNGVKFRTGIDGILTKKIEESDVNETSLRGATLYSQNSTLKKLYTQK
jgi:hypothetical protein